MNFLTLLLFVACLSNRVQAFLYNVTVHMSDEEFETVNGYVYAQFVQIGSNFSDAIEVSQRLDTFKPRTIVSNVIDIKYSLEQIDYVLFEWEMSLFRPLRHWLRKPFIIIRMVQLAPLYGEYIQNSLAREMKTKHFESDFGPIRAHLDQWYKLDNLIDNEILP